MRRCICILFCMTLFLGCSPEKKQSSQPVTLPEEKPAKNIECNLRIGYDTWEPYQFMDIDNKVKGLDIDLLVMLMKKIGCHDYEFKIDVWVELLKMMREGEVDVVMGASITKSRKEFALFSDAYRQEEFRLYVRTEELHLFPYTQIEEILQKNKKVGVIDEYYYGNSVSKLRDNEAYQSLFVSGVMSEVNIARLMDHQIDSFLEDSFVGAALIKRKGLQRYISPHSIHIRTGPVYIMFSKKTVSPELVGKFNQALQVIRENGSYQRLLEKYSKIDAKSG